MGPVYTVFYGGLIQPIQIALGIKHLDSNKVEKTYEQASILVLRILKKAERQAYDAFLVDMEKSCLFKLVELSEEPRKLADWLATKMLDWLDTKIATTTDMFFRVGLHFVKAAR